MRYLSLVLIALVPLLLAARTEPAQVEQPEHKPARNFTISGSNLSITPDENVSRLSFSGGVSCVTAEMELHADVLTLDLQTSKVTGGTRYEPPKSDVPTERLVESPGETVREMAAEMKIPSAQFNASAIRRVAAQGNVEISVEGFNLVTTELVSLDGGRSWAASGRSTLSHCDEQGSCYELGADYILYDRETQKALARGGIAGNYRSGEDAEPVQISAERVELDIASSVISASEYLEIVYRSYILCCGSLTADIRGNQVRATDSPRLQQPDMGLTASAAEISIDLENMVLTATGGITVTDTERGIELTAEQLTADLEQNRLEASGSPHLAQGDSTFDGERIVVFEEDGKTVIEIDGPQRARLDLDELEAGAQGIKEGAPHGEEPPVDSD